MSSELLTEVKRIVRGYFNSAVVVDDELFNEQTDDTDDYKELFNEDLEIENTDLGLGEFAIQVADQEKTIVEEMYNADAVYNDLLSDGVITVPWRYKHNEDIRDLNSVLFNSKMLIVDWMLVPSIDSYKMGDDTLELINKFNSQKKGLKCAVIYTQEDLSDVKEKVEYNYAVKDICNIIHSKPNECFFFEEKNENNSLFGFIINKYTKATKIIDYISQVLLKDKSIALHLMDSSIHLNDNINKAISIFNTPYEEVLFSQILTSDLPLKKIANIINDTFLTSIMQMEQQNDQLDDKKDFLYETKKREILTQLETLKSTSLDTICNLLNIKSKSTVEDILIKQQEYKHKIIEGVKSSFSVQSLKMKINEIVNDIPNPPKKLKLELPLVILYLNNAERLAKGNAEGFKKMFLQQVYNFTKVMKYVEPDNHITNGSILKDPNTENKFLLCITPLCDTVRPEKVEYYYKFLVGEKLNDYKPENLKNDKPNHYYLAVPIDGELSIIKWNFYQVKTAKLQDEMLNFKPIINLKKEYIQKIANLYTSYQSRAGVDELFYKESNYINNFLEILRKS